MGHVPQAFLNYEREYKSRATKRGKLIVLFSPQGGVGRTTIAANLAIALYQSTQKRVALVDGSLPFGDIAVSLNIRPEAKTIADLVGSFDNMDADILESVMVAHSTGIKVLLAPPTPDSTELITGPNVQRMLELLDERYAYIVVDTWPSFQEQVIRMLDMADLILVPVTLEVACLRNVRVFLEITDLLGYSAKKVQLVANRVDKLSIRATEAAAVLGKTFLHAIAWDRPLFARATHRAMPLVWGEGTSPAARELRQLAEKVLHIWPGPAEAVAVGSKSVAPGSTAARVLTMWSWWHEEVNLRIRRAFLNSAEALLLGYFRFWFRLAEAIVLGYIRLFKIRFANWDEHPLAQNFGLNLGAWMFVLSIMLLFILLLNFLGGDCLRSVTGGCAEDPR